jgi:hypothetical protein
MTAESTPCSTSPATQPARGATGGQSRRTVGFAAARNGAARGGGGEAVATARALAASGPSGSVLDSPPADGDEEVAV